MPKVLDNPRQKLLQEARCQVEEKGYSAMTIRSVAKACHVSVGTVYNYFPSKEALVATHLLEDWTRCVDAIRAVSTYSDQPRPVALCIYDQLAGFDNVPGLRFKATAFNHRIQILFSCLSHCQRIRISGINRWRHLVHLFIRALGAEARHNEEPPRVTLEVKGAFRLRVYSFKAFTHLLRKEKKLF